MPRVIHVKKARRALPAHGIEVGASYYWWSFRVGRGSVKRYSLTPPKASQLTNSEFLSTAYALNERLDALEAGEGLADERDDIVSEIRDLASETEEKLGNMPEGLQQGDTGQLLQSRVDSCNEWADNLEQVDIPEWDSEEFLKGKEEDEDEEDEEPSEDGKARISVANDDDPVVDEDKRDQAFADARDELQSHTYEGE